MFFALNAITSLSMSKKKRKDNEININLVAQATEDNALQTCVETAEATASFEAAESLSSQVDGSGTQKAKKRKKIRHKMHEIVDAGHDIRFRGPFSFRHLRIIGWIALAISQIAVFTSMSATLNEALAPRLDTLSNVLQAIGTIAIPLFLIANFARILSVDGGYKSLLIIFGGISLAFILGFFIVYQHYIVGILNAFGGQELVNQAGPQILNLIGGGNYFAFNLFLDLFLCTLLNFFLNYHPKKAFQGKKIILFRLMALLPILYEFASMVLKIYASIGGLKLSVYLYPFLTVKPPMSIVLFIALSLFIKLREWMFLRRGKSHEDYDKFLSTNVNSLHFSIYTSVMILISVVIDVILLISITAALVPPHATREVILSTTEQVNSWGFGSAVPLILTIPFVMLFSYTRKYTTPLIDIIIAVAGVALVAIVLIEGGFRFICTIPDVVRKLAGGINKL